MYTALETIVKPSLSTSSRKNLRFDDKILRAYRTRLVSLKVTNEKLLALPKFFATSKASSGDLAAMLLGVAIPYFKQHMKHISQT